MPTSVNDQINLTSLKFTSYLVRLLNPPTYLSLVFLSEDTEGNSKGENRGLEKRNAEMGLQARCLQAVLTTQNEKTLLEKETGN